MSPTFDVLADIARAGASGYLNKPIRSEAQARQDRAYTEALALRLVIDTERSALNRWHKANYTGPADAFLYAERVMQAFGRIVAARDEMQP